MKERCVYSMDELENIALSARGQTQQRKYCMIPFMWNIQNWQIHRDRKQRSSFQGLEEEEWQVTTNRSRVSVRVNDVFWDLIIVTVAQPCDDTKKHWSGCFERMNFHGVWIRSLKTQVWSLLSMWRGHVNCWNSLKPTCLSSVKCNGIGDGR